MPTRQTGQTHPRRSIHTAEDLTASDAGTLPGSERSAASDDLTWVKE